MLKVFFVLLGKASYETKTLAWMYVWREERQLPEQVYPGKGLQETEYL